MKDSGKHVVEFPAKILDSDNQLLSTGKARLYTKLFAGTFWPQEQEGIQTIQERAAILQAESGSQYRLKDFHTCRDHHPDIVNHCEFYFEPI